MKKVCKIIALSLVLIITVALLASCGDKSAAIKSAFEKEGYKVESIQYEKLDATTKEILETVLGQTIAANMAQYEIMVCTKAIPLAVVVKFPATNEMKEALATIKEDGSKIYDVYETLEKAGAINGNCLLLTILPGPAEIFKNA